jgi:23S rRNA (uracil1939-C5)-methyltransferase
MNTFELEITSLTSEGQGVGRKDGLAVFARGAVPGDFLKVKIITNNKTYAIAEIVEIITPSKDRIKPSCKIADECGGCSLQNMSYDAQLKWKQDMVVQAMTRIGGFSSEFIIARMQNIIGTENIFHYRNNVQMPVSGDATSPKIGFYENNSHEVADTDICLLQHEIADTIRLTIRKFIIENNIPPFNETTGEGLLKHVVIRVGFATGQVMVVLVLNKRDLSFFPKLSEKLKIAIEDKGMILTSLYANINPGKAKGGLGNDKRVSGDEYVLIYGQKFIEEILCGLKFKISPMAFFQVNTAQAQQLYQKVIEFASLKATDKVFDLYCGTGSIALAMAKYCQKVYGVEIVKQAIDDAKENALGNSIRNVEFYTGKSEIVFPQLIEKGAKADIVVLDPPRKGADIKLLNVLLQALPNKIVYLSCNPATLARDCKILCGSGEYELTKIVPVDMFPWTGHVEAIVLMSRV